MIEQRRVRFASIDGITRSDLPIAAEIWLDDLSRQPWPTRDVLKLAIHLKRYMAEPNPKDLVTRVIERHTQLDRKAVMDALRQMLMYGAVEAYSLEGEVVRASLTLSVLQRLRTLEVRNRYIELEVALDLDRTGARFKEDNKWLPENAGDGLDAGHTADASVEKAA